MTPEERLICHWLTWRIKIQTLAATLDRADKEGLPTWKPVLTETLLTAHAIAAQHGPFAWETAPVQPWPPYLALSVGKEALFADTMDRLARAFGFATSAATLRTEGKL